MDVLQRAHLAVRDVVLVSYSLVIFPILNLSAWRVTVVRGRIT